ncbi:MAG: 4Fe-4S dicluster domain-containing protein [Chloroflexota bacterium]|nr:4Fe-4S dicluster domain-containing protein [Chloroflexota bacterium]
MQTIETRHPDFAREVRERSGTALDRCYQCLTCSLGCPVAPDMDYMPNQVIRMVQLGLKDQVLSSGTIWLCATCETCVARCPNDVDVLRVMDTLREMALEQGAPTPQPQIPIFHRTSLESIKLWGRQHELSMILLLKLRSRDLFSDLLMGVKMILKGKLKIVPQRIKGLKDITAIFQRVQG